MNQTYSHNDLLSLIYGETQDNCVDFKVKQEILVNDALAAEYRELKNAVSILNANELSPKSSTVNAILQKSKRTEKELV